MSVEIKLVRLRKSRHPCSYFVIVSVALPLHWDFYWFKSEGFIIITSPSYSLKISRITLHVATAFRLLTSTMVNL